MPLDIAVIGNADNNVGFACAADLTLAGHRVSLALWPDQAAALAPIEAHGGFEVQGDTSQLVSMRNGTARLHRLGCDPAEAVKRADVVLLDVPPAELERRFAELLPHLEPGQLVHLNSHGGWPALRVAPLLRKAGREDVTLTEGAAPTIAAGYDPDGAVVTPHALRRQLAIAAFPAERTDAALVTLNSAYPQLEAARNVLQTGFEAMNLLVHPAIALLNIGHFDRAEQADELVSFYGAGNTVHTARFAEAHDAERAPVCAAFDVPYRSLHQHILRYYDAHGDGVHDAIRNCGFYRKLAPMPAKTWRKWLSVDVPTAHVPFVAFAELAGIAVPLHRAMIAIVSALLGEDFSSSGLTLARLGLDSASVHEVHRYVHSGDAVA